MEMKWTKLYAKTSHVIAYLSLELLFGTPTFHFNCFFEDFNCVFTQIRCLSRVIHVTVGNFFRSPNQEHLVITGHETMTDNHAVEMRTMNFSSLSSYKS